jgi:hypothetical protein
VKFPLNLTPAYPDRAKKRTNKTTQTNEKTRQTTQSEFPGTFLLNWPQAPGN